MSMKLHVVAGSHPCAGVIADVAPLLAGRSASALTRHFPPMVGHIPAGTAPPDWLETSAPPQATGT
jgi:hypothetical protein